jgi:hypothetical protein
VRGSENFSFVGLEVITSMDMKSFVFCDISPCCPLKVNRRFISLITCFMLCSSLDFSSILKMEAKYSSETSVEFNGLNAVVSQKIEIFSLFSVPSKDPHEKELS